MRRLRRPFGTQHSSCYFNGVERTHMTFNISDLVRSTRRLSRVDITPLDQERRTAVPTDAAAWHMSRAPQTLRLWACHETGPIKPIRLHGRLLWPTSEIRRVLGVPG